MELIVISDTKLKVMLTPVDMDTYHLDCATMDYEDNRTRRAFGHLFDEVRQRCGFDASCDRVLVQVYPGGDGGCELFVTKLASGTTRSEKRSGAVIRCRKYWYVFPDLTAVLSVCRVLNDGRYHRPSDLWLGEDARWYLMLEAGPRVTDQPDPLAIVEEYGSRCAPGGEEIGFAEHARRIAAGNAVEVLAPLA